MKFWIGAAATVALAAGLALSGTNEYFFYAGYVVLQFVVLATAWNILGGYAGYVNFGTAAFFGIGAYTAVVLFKAVGAPLGVLKLKLFACTVSGALMGAAGAPLPMYMSFLEPASSFDLNYSVSALAMPMIGGTSHWLGPVIGAILLGSIQQIVTVTISNEINVLVVGVLLVVFVVAAPDGILGLLKKLRWLLRSSR